MQKLVKQLNKHLKQTSGNLAALLDGSDELEREEQNLVVASIGIQVERVRDVLQNYTPETHVDAVSLLKSINKNPTIRTKRKK